VITVNDTTTLDAARAYLAAGLRPIALHALDENRECTCPKGAACGRSAGKHPIDRAWQRSTMTDANAAATWGAGGDPHRGVGLLTGGALLVLDVDGERGRATLAALEAEHGSLPVTMAAQSGRADGGEHRYFRKPVHPAIRNSAGRLGPGLDVRGEGGQVVAPPTLHASGARYRWTDDAPIADAPTWLLDLLTREVEPSSSAPAPFASSVALDERRRRARAWLAKADPAIEGAYGSNVAIRIANGVAVGFDLDDDEAFALLLEWNARCSPPWPLGKLRRKIVEALTS
jgi:hypothetical protein